MISKTPLKRLRFTWPALPAVIGVIFIISLIGVFIGTMTGSRQVLAATQSTITFQARLQAANGSIAPDGFYNVQFKLYDALTAGTNLWTESYYDTNGVTAGNDFRVRVQNGYLSVNLGSQTAFPTTINWDQPLYLTMNVGGVTQTATPTYDGEMSPRLGLTAVPYAFKAGQLAKTTGTNISTLDFASQTAANTLLLPNESGTLCVQSSANCGFLTGAAANGSYVQLQSSTPGTQQTGNLNISGVGNFGSTVNAVSGFKSNGVAGSTATCSGGQVLQNTVLSGGIITAGACASVAGSGATTMGAIDGQAKAAEGATINGTALYLQSADATNPGLVTAGTQTFGGNKTFAGTLAIGNAYSVYRWRTPGASDLAYKTIANITIGTGTFQGISFQVDVNNANGNAGSAVETGLKYYASFNASGAVQGDTTAATVSGPQNEYVQAVRTSATGVIPATYELQVRQPVNFQTVGFTAQVTSQSGNAAVTYVNAPATGSAGTATYSPSALHTDYFSKINTNGGVNINSSGITNAGAIAGAFSVTGLNNLVLQAAGTFTTTLDTVGAGTVNVATNAATLNLGNSAANNTALNMYGNTTIKTPVTNNVGALQVQNANGTNLFRVDTANNRVFIGDTFNAGVFPKLYFGDAGATLNNAWIAESGAADTDILQLQGRNGINLSTGSTATTNFSLGSGGQATFQQSSDTVSGFVVQDAENTVLLNVDNVNKKVAVGGDTLEAFGSINQLRYNDTFTSTTLDAGWSLNPPVGTMSTNTGYSLTANPGYLRLSTNAGSEHDCYQNSFNCANILRTATNADAYYQTELTQNSIPTYSYTGIMIKADANNFITISFQHCGCGTTYATAEWYNSGTYVSGNQIPVTLGTNNIIRVYRNGSYYLPIYSLDGGANWSYIGSGSANASFNVNWTPTQAGLFAATYNGTSSPALTADFNNFLTYTTPNGAVATQGMLVRAGTADLPANATGFQVQNSAGATIFNVNATGKVSSFQGNLCVNLTNCTKALAIQGDMYLSGTQYSSGSPDVAEYISAASDVTAYDVVMPDPNKEESVIRATGDAGKAIGIISDGSSSQINQSLHYGRHDNALDDPTARPLVIAGRIPTHVTNENGAIHPGDPLTLSATKPGYAMKATQAGNTIGTSLGNFDATDGTVLVLMHLGYFDPATSNALADQIANLQSQIDAIGTALNTVDLRSVRLTVTGNASINGDLVVLGTSRLGNLQLSGHIQTTGPTPTLTLMPGAGNVDVTTGTLPASVTIRGNDVSGTITLVAGPDPKADSLVRLRFMKSYNTAPNVLITPVGKETGVLQGYVESVSPEGFSLGVGTVPITQRTYVWSYQVMETTDP